ncbi:MAG: trigger factor [Anaerolineae bacterium]
MKVNAERTENCQAVLTIEVEEERVERSLKEAARRISKRTPIPGFRAGRAPYHIVERMVGKEVVFDEALEELSSQVYREALEESELEPIDRAEMEVVEREPLTLKMTVPLRPEVELGDYQSLHVEPQEVKVKEEEIEEVLTALREERGEWVPVEREAQEGDLLTLEVEGKADGERVVGAEEWEYVLRLGAEVPVKGFPEMIEGMKPGEVREFTLAYPVTHPHTDLAGRKVEFRVRLLGLKGKQLPPLDDEFAKTVGDFESLKELRERIESVLQARAETRERERVAEEVLSAMTDQAKIAYPSALLERELDSMIEDYARAVARQGFTLPRYLEVVGKSEEELRRELRPQAEERLKKALVFSQFTEEEGIAIEDEEVGREVDEIADSYGDQAEEVKKALLSPEPQRSIRSRLFSQKALERLVEIGTATPEEKAEEEKKATKSKVLTLEDIEEEKKRKGKKKESKKVLTLEDVEKEKKRSKKGG